MDTTSTSLLETRADLGSPRKLVCAPRKGGKHTYEIRLSERSLWMIARSPGKGGLALRLAYSPDGALEIAGLTQNDGALGIELTASIGRFRIRCEFPTRNRPAWHSTTWLTPTKSLTLPFWPRDLYPVDRSLDPLATQGTVHTAQRGPRTGLIFASLEEPRAGTFLYWQNFGELNEYCKTTQTTPADRVGGAWPELGYAPAPNNDHPLKAANEISLSDVFLAFDPEVPANDCDAARLFLDMLAQSYLALPRPNPMYHHWPDKAEATVRDLAFSPECTYERQGRRYLMPYVGDREKPPESMVQFTVMLPMLEYEVWSNRSFVLTRRLVESIPSFFNPKIDTLVRWLPGERFGDTGEEGQKHENMDSWYLYHVLFNLSRLATLGDPQAKRLFRKSLPYAIKVARRFDYRFPIFFNLETLEVVRAESKPGAGGENDVAGLYALVMMHAHEMLGDKTYLEEAKKAAQALEQLGFKLGYQMNTTGFAAEALLRLFLETKDEHYLDLSNVCLANIFENMWIWQCDYGYARYYHTFFGLFPLRDAPYLAPYEELEALAKFHDYLKMGGEAIRPSVRRLLAEYGKYALDRVWHYFPASLPYDALATKNRNGHLDRNLAIPLEDLQDGWTQSGEVGQEIYGAGVALVYTTRHYKHLENTGVQLFCEYPILNYKASAGRCTFDVGGDDKLTCKLRLIPTDPTAQPPRFDLALRSASGAPNLKGALSSEGHLVFDVRGGAALELRWRANTVRKR